MTGQHHLRGVLLASLACMMWGISGVVASSLFTLNTHVTALWLSEVRMTTAGIVLLIIAQLIGAKPMRLWQHKNTAGRIVSYGLLGMVPVQLCYFEAVKFGNAPIATIIQFLGPFIISIYYFLFKHTKPTRPESLGMVIAFVGTFLIVTHGHVNALAISPVVLFWGFLSAIGVATNTLLPRPLFSTYGSLSVTGWGLLIAGLSLNFVKPVWQFHTTVTATEWTLVAIIIVFGTVIPFQMFAHSLAYILPTTATLLDAFEPLAATVFSVIFLSVQLTGFDLVGGALIILAVMILSMNSRKLVNFFHRRRSTT